MLKSHNFELEEFAAEMATMSIPSNAHFLAIRAKQLTSIAGLL